MYFTEFMEKLRNPAAPKSPLGAPRSAAPKLPVVASDASGSKEMKSDKRGESWKAKTPRSEKRAARPQAKWEPNKRHNTASGNNADWSNRGNGESWSGAAWRS